MEEDIKKRIYKGLGDRSALQPGVHVEYCFTQFASTPCPYLCPGHDGSKRNL